MDSKSEYELLKSFCEDKPIRVTMIKDFLKIDKEKSLQMRKRGIRSEVEGVIDKYKKMNIL